MYFVLGLLTAGLLALLVMPAIWRRTARLTRQRIENSLPLTMAEIQADRDQLRAEFAIGARKLELAVDRLRDKTSEQVIEINEKRAEIVRLTSDRNEKTKTIEELEERAAQLVADVAAADDRQTELSEEIKKRDQAIVARDTDIADLKAQLSQSQQLADEQKLELVARNTEIGNLNDRVAQATTTELSLKTARDTLAEELAAEKIELVAERRRTENLEASVARLEAERIDRLAELERRATEVGELTAELAKARADAEGHMGQISEHAEDRRHANGGVEDEAIPIDGDNVAKALASAEAENAALSQRLAALEAEHASLRAQNDDLKRVASADWDIETENAQLRARLADVAANVLQLTRTSDEANSGSAALPAEHKTTNGGNGSDRPEEAAQPSPPAPEAGERGTPPPGKSLAERLRALQHTSVGH